MIELTPQVKDSRISVVLSMHSLVLVPDISTINLLGYQAFLFPSLKLLKPSVLCLTFSQPCKFLLQRTVCEASTWGMEPVPEQLCCGCLLWKGFMPCISSTNYARSFGTAVLDPWTKCSGKEWGMFRNPPCLCHASLWPVPVRFAS